MIVTLIAAPKRTFIYITVQIDGLRSPICLRNTDAYNLRSIHIHYIDIVVKKDVLIHLIAVEGIPEVRNNLHRLIHANYLVTLPNVLLLHDFIHTKQNQSANRISESRIGRPNRLWHLRLSPFALQRHPLTLPQRLLYCFLVHMYITFSPYHLFCESRIGCSN